MFIRLVLFLFFILLTGSVYAQTVVADDPRGYKIIRPGEYGTKLQIIYQEEVFYEAIPQIEEKIDLAYGYLANRGSFEQQPKVFDDLTGDGNPDVLFIEKGPLSNAPMQKMVLRMVSIVGGKTEEIVPYSGFLGEILYFDDFNKDGVFELVNTDQERYFLYARDGTPISKYVLLFDTVYKHFYPATLMVGDEK